MGTMTASGNRRVRHSLAVAAILGLLAACGGGGSDADGERDDLDENAGRVTVPEENPTYGGTLVFGVSAETDGWTPQTNNFADAGSFVASTVIEPLAHFDVDGTVVPHLAESWEHNEDLDVWTVEIRDGIEFHDGEALDAEAVKVNLDTALSAPIVGLALGPIVDEVEVIGPMTVEIRLHAPWSAFPAMLLANQAGLIVSPKMFEEDHYGALHPVGTGPFVFKEWVQGDRFTAVRNEDYWRTAENGDELPYLDSIEFRVYVDSQSRALALESGEIDMMYTVRTQEIAQYKGMAEQGEITLIQDNHREETFVQLNQNRPPFDNLHARRAAALAVDPTALVAVLGEGVTQPIEQMFREEEPYYSSEPGYVSYDPDEARRELELYKEDTGEDTLSFQLTGLPSVDDLQLLQLLIQQWDQVGIDAELKTVEQTTFSVDLATASFDASYYRNFGWTDPDGGYSFLHSSYAVNEERPVGINFTSTRVDELDDLLDAQRQTIDPAERAEIWQEIVPVVNEELPYIWLFNTPYALVAVPEVQGLNTVRELGFGNFEPKWWIGELWRAT